MDERGFATLDDFRGHSLQYFTTHADLVERQKQARRDKAGRQNRDNDWKGDIAKESEALTVNTD